MSVDEFKAPISEASKTIRDLHHFGVSMAGFRVMRSDSTGADENISVFAEREHAREINQQCASKPLLNARL